MNEPRRAVLVADDEETIRRLLDYNLQKNGFRTVLACHGKDAIALASDDLACALVDLRMPEADGMAVLSHFKKHFPDIPVLMISAVGQIRDAVLAMKSGAFEYVTKPFDLDEVIALVHSAVRLGHALQENRQWREAATSPIAETCFVGDSPAAVKLRDDIERIARLDVTVLLTGESGVGKGLVARLIHRSSHRAASPFVTVSCPALPRELLESEMFGHERGAFTGAQQRRIGRVEMAAGGTLFLDEIGDLPLLLQPKLLNVLQDRQFQRLGGSQILKADVRLVTATNVDLEEKVAAREFREDLYYRLKVIPLGIPPLRERISDLPLISRQILDRIAIARSCNRLQISDAALALMAQHRWPGNVRELENILERGSAFCRNNVIEPGDLAIEPQPTLQTPRPDSTLAGVPNVGGMSLEDLERLALQQTLALCDGNKAAAARRLGVTEKTIYNKLTRLGLR